MSTPKEELNEHVGKCEPPTTGDTIVVVPSQEQGPGKTFCPISITRQSILSLGP